MANLRKGTRTLTESEAYTLLHALQVAAEQFDRNAKSCEEMPQGHRLANQFTKQAGEVRTLRVDLEDATAITLEVPSAS